MQLSNERPTVDREVFRTLVRGGGVDVTVVGKDGQTPLHLLLDRPEKECISLMNILQEYQRTFTILHSIMMHGTAAQLEVRNHQQKLLRRV